MSEKALAFSSTVFSPRVMSLEYIPLSHSGMATCKCRREDTLRMRSHGCTVFGSFGDSRKHNEGQRWSPENPVISEHTYSGQKARPLPGGWIFEDLLGCKLQNPILKGRLLQERECYILQSVMDGNNFNILWTEALWVGNKTPTPQYLNQGNCLYLKQTPSKIHNWILLKEKWNNISISDQKENKTIQFALEKHPVSSVLSQAELTDRFSVKSRGTQSSF